MSEGSDGLTMRQLVLPIYLPALLFGVSRSLIEPVLPLFAREDLQAGDTVVGAAVAAVGLGTACTNVLSGLVISRIGAVQSFWFAMAVHVLASLWGAASASVLSLLCARVLSGWAMSLWSVSRQSFLSEFVPPRRRGRAMSTLGGVGRVSSIVGPLAGGFIAEHISTRACFVSQAVIAGAVLAMMLMTWPRVRSVMHRQRKASTLAGVVPAALNAPRGSSCAMARAHAWPLASTAGWAAALMTMRSARKLLIPLQGHDLGLSKSQIGTIVATGWLVDSLMFPFAGYVMDRFGRKWAGAPAIGLLALAAGLTGTTTDALSLGAVSALAGFGNGFSAGLVMTLGADLAPPSVRSQFLGVYRTITDTGTLLGPIASGAITDAWEVWTSGLCGAGFGAAGFLWMLCCVSETLEKRKHRGYQRAGTSEHDSGATSDSGSDGEFGLDSDDDYEGGGSVSRRVEIELAGAFGASDADEDDGFQHRRAAAAN